MNNLDRIKDMNADDMAKVLINDNKCEFCIYEDDICQTSQCMDGINKWLKIEDGITISELISSHESYCNSIYPNCRYNDCQTCNLQYIVNHFDINNRKVTKIDK